MNTPPTRHLIGWFQLAKKLSVTTLRLQSPAAAEEPELLCRAVAPLALPRAPSEQRSLTRALFSTEQTLVSWHWGSCISPALWLHSSSIFNHDIGVYFSILPANAVLTEKMLLSAILHDNPHLWWTGSLQRTTVRQVITSGTRCFPENLK